MPIELEWEISERVEGLETLLGRVVDVCFELEGIPKAHMTVRIVDSETIRALNREMRNIDRETDVLSFPSVNFRPGTTARDNPKRLRREYDPSVGMVHIGDCAVSLSRAREQAEEYGHSLMRELGYLTAHSAFHLMGYDHMTDEDKQKMRAMEKRAMDIVDLHREETEPVTDQMLYEKACEALKNSYAPYSNFHVAACLLAEDGRTFTGCNFENASYGATICAERCAVAVAINSGARSFTAIAVVTDGDTDPWPCGICRQVLNEFSKDMRVICGRAGTGEFKVLPLTALLPHSFGPNDLIGGN